MTITKFLENVELSDGKTHSIVVCLVEYLNRQHLDTSRIVSLATDGAFVMMGKHTGVGVQMKSKCVFVGDTASKIEDVVSGNK